MRSDVLIIGGGLIGLAIARELHKAGAGSITVIERDAIGRAASYAAAGMLSTHCETDRFDDFYRLCAESGKLYPALALALLDETGVDIQLERSGTLSLAFTDADSAVLRRRLKLHASMGFDTQYLSAAQVLESEPLISPDVRGALFFPNDHQVENRKLLAALIKYADINGIRLVENSEAHHLIADGDRVIGASTPTGSYFAGHTLLTTGAWTSLIKIGNIDVPVGVRPVKGQIICFRMDERRLTRVMLSRSGYIVPRMDGRVLVGSTEEDKGFEADTTYKAREQLRVAAVEMVPSLAAARIIDHWAGLRPLAPDGFPVIGTIEGITDLTVATGHYRNGILLAPITAKIVADSITGSGASRYLDIFGPGRFHSASRVSAL